jgi:hypothetical protein
MSGKTIVPIEFSLGRLVATPNALSHLSEAEILTAITRHLSGDWGELGEEDWLINDAAVKNGSRLLSVFPTGKGVRFWVITEADRSATTVMLPEDY